MDEAAIRGMVHAFYARVRDDELLGPVFAPRVGDAWDPHLERMVAFWSAVLLGRPGFRGDPVGKHRAIPELTPEHFDRWLALFAEVLDERFPAPVAADIHARASRMRVVLEADPRRPAATGGSRSLSG